MLPPFPRPPNEVWAAIELVEEALAGDGDPTLWVQVATGVDPAAKIVSVRREGSWLVLVYDRPVEEPSFRSRHEGPA